jgi:DNA repair exonuclease SbcCD ATPase subunit
MQLSNNHRRDVIEDLLDIGVFSSMNVILKEQNQLLKQQMSDMEYTISLNQNKIEAQRKYINDIALLNEEHRKEKQELIDQCNQSIDNLQKQNVILNEQVTSKQELLNSQQALNTKINSLTSYKQTFDHKIKELVKHCKFYDDNDTCPTCEQEIADNIREVKRDQAKEKASELNIAITQVTQQIEQARQELMTEVQQHLNRVIEIESEISSNNREISSLQSQITSLQSQISDNTTGDMVAAENELQQAVQELNDNISTKHSIAEQQRYNIVVGELLKDTGIKTKIIKQYLPVINQLVNQYLQVLDFYVHFDLDESFTETIKSRHRDTFSYASFSEGEKQRIDLALLFTWRQIAKMKNSVATNLLVLDETFDSSLDQDGVENLLKILHTLGEDTNVFVISHKGDILEGKFDNKLEFIKERNFSVVI